MPPSSRLLPWLWLAVWAAFLFLGLRLMEGAPPVWMAQRILVELPPGRSVDLGRHALGMPEHDRSVAEPHLRVARDPEGGWRFSNLSERRKVDLRTDLVNTRYLRRWALAGGDRIRLDGREIRVLEADDQAGLVLEADDGDQVLWRDGRLASERHATYPYCRFGDGPFGRIGAGLHETAARWRWDYRHWRAQQELPLFSLGGQVQCAERWALQDLPPMAARIYWRNGRFWLGAVRQGTREQLARKAESGGKRLGAQSLPLDGPEGRVDRLVLGRTHYRVRFDSRQLILEPYRNLPVAFEPFGKRTLPDGVKLYLGSSAWIGSGNLQAPGSRAWIAGGLLLVATSIFALFLQALQRARGERRGLLGLWFASLPSWLFLWVAVAGWRALAADLGWALGICASAWLAASLQLWFQGRLAGRAGALWLAGTILAAVGALTLTQLGAGAANTKWLVYASGHLRMLTLIAALAALAAWFPGAVWRNLLYLFFANRGGAAVLKSIALAAVIGLLIAQLVVGDETGLGWLQPVELAKFALVFLLASSLTHLRWLRRTDSRDYRLNRRQRILTALLVAGAFAIASSVIMFGVHDNSPLLIVFALILPFFWIAASDPLLPRASRTWVRRGLLVVLPLGLVVAGGAWLWHHPPDYLSAIPQADRFRVWSDPWINRLSGEQLIQALERVREGGWSGVSTWFGSNGAVVSLPAVQDDFIAAFLLNRFGGLAGLGLMLVQTWWCGLLLTLGLGSMGSASDATEARGPYWLGALLFGLGWMQAAHWAISWGNVLGLLPVMGQPMTWLSSGNSHMLALAASSLVLGMIGAWVEAEK